MGALVAGHAQGKTLFLVNICDADRYLIDEGQVVVGPISAPPLAASASTRSPTVRRADAGSGLVPVPLPQSVRTFA
jgi:hypothetical protein